MVSQSRAGSKRPRSADELLCDAQEFLDKTDWKGLAGLKTKANDLVEKATKAATSGVGDEEEIRSELDQLIGGVKEAKSYLAQVVELEENVRKLTEAKDAEAKKNLKALEDKDAEIAEARERIKVFEEENRKRFFLIQMGDWWNGIHKAFKWYDKKEQTFFEDTVVQPALIAKLPRGKKLVKGAAKDAAWESLSGKRSDEVISQVKAEWELIDDWIKNGEPPNIPQTPTMDRIDKLCSELGESTNDYLATVKNYSDRNAISHFPPPDLAPYVRGHEDCDWDGFDKEIADAQAKLVAQFHSEGLPELMKESMKMTASMYRRMYIKQDTSATSSLWVPTQYADECVRLIWTKRTDKTSKSAIEKMVPESQFKRAKFNHLDKAAMNDL